MNTRFYVVILSFYDNYGGPEKNQCRRNRTKYLQKMVKVQLMR